MTIIIRRPEVLRRTGLSRTGLYDRMQSGDFPQSVPLGKETLKQGKVRPVRARGWVLDEVDAWVDTNIRARGTEVRGEARAR